MTTKIHITNDNSGPPHADWSIEVKNSCDCGGPRILKPGESGEFYLWHDGRELTIRELRK